MGARTSPDWKDLTLEIKDAAAGWFLVRAIDRDSGAECWQVDLDATSGRGDLFPHISQAVIVSEVALLQTFGEHSRGATSHQHQIHCLSADGNVLWTHPWQIEPTVEGTERGLLLVVRLATYRVPDDGHLFDVCMVGSRTGEIEKQRPIVLPAPWVRDLQATAWPQVHASLISVDDRWGIRVRAWLSSTNAWAEYDVSPPW